MYKYDLHMHTIEGSACGRSSIHDMIRRLHSLGFSGAAVTNHFLGGNTSVDRSLPWDEIVREFSVAYEEGLKTAKELDFDLFFGIEQGYGNGKEFLVYGITPQFLYDRPVLRSNSLELWYDEVHAAGGFLAFAHPFRDRAYIKYADEMPDLSLCDGIEVYNYCNLPHENEKAFDIFSKTDKILIAGGDHHADSLPDSYGVEFSERVRTGDALVAHLLSGNFRLSIDR